MSIQARDLRDVRDVAEALAAALRDGDLAAAAELFETDPSVVVFDIDGHVYRGARHWAGRPATAPRVGRAEPEIAVRGTAAWVTWVDEVTSARTTAVVVQAGGGWRITHLHCSPLTPGPRPGTI